MLKVISMRCEDLIDWVKNKAEPGDIAYWYKRDSDQHYYYIYVGPDHKPYWNLWFEGDIIDKLEEIDKLKIEELKMEKKCENCRYFNQSTFKTEIQDSWCSHEKYSGIRVAAHTSCPEFEEKEKKSTPFDGIKFYLKDTKTGELTIKYTCEDCGKEMNKPDHWWMKVPFGNAIPEDLGFHFRCEECDKKKKGET
jgi:Zn finger protein HypA/HybF involved in hydrogenase expression